MKILYTATVLSHICQFHLPHLKMLRDAGHEIHVAAHDNLAVKNGLKLQHTDKFHEIAFKRSPFDSSNLKAYRQLKKVIDSENFDIILCNTPVGGIVTRLAAIGARERGTKVIYMAHGFHFCKGAPLKNWLIYYPIEKFMAHFCDTLITICKEDYELARKKFATKVEHIHGVGVSPERFHPVDDETKHLMREKENLKDDDFVILCVGELNKNKNQTVLIQAAAELKDKIPNLRVLLAGNGPMEQTLKNQVQNLDLTEQVRFLGYRTDLETITPAVEVVVSCSKREGLPLNILEAMLCAKPVIVSRNRGHNELITDGENGYFENYAQNISDLYNNPSRSQSMGKCGLQSVQKYMVMTVKSELKQIFTV